MCNFVLITTVYSLLQSMNIVLIFQASTLQSWFNEFWYIDGTFLLFLTNSHATFTFPFTNTKFLAVNKNFMKMNRIGIVKNVY